MSGISSGSIFFTPAVMILAAYYTAESIVKSTGKCLFAGAIAVHNYNQKKEKQKIKQLNSEAEKINNSVINMLSSQSEKFRASTELMIESISKTHTQLADSINDDTTLNNFVQMLADSQKNTLAGIDRVNSEFQRNYTDSINKSNAEILTALNRLKESISDELNSLQADIEMKNALARQRAAELTDDAENLAEAFGISYTKSLTETAKQDICDGNYQAAISVAFSAITDIYMNMYKSDAIKKEKEYFKNSCIFLIAEMNELLNGLKSTEVRKSKDSEATIKIDITQFMDGRHIEFSEKIVQAENKIKNNSDDLTVHDIRKLTDELSKLYIQINQSISEAFYLMTYSLNRVETEKNIYNILREKGFSLKDTLYTNGDPSKSSERIYRCELTGEELSISMIPYTDDENEFKTQILMQSNDVNCSEESREQYRKEIIRTLKENCKNVDNINIKCHEETRCKNAVDVRGNKPGIVNPQHAKTVQG